MSANKRDKIATRTWDTLYDSRSRTHKQEIRLIRAALEEAVDEERKALREIVERALPPVKWNILAALDARSKPQISTSDPYTAKKLDAALDQFCRDGKWSKEKP